MDPTQVNPNGNQVPGSDNAQRSVFGAPLQPEAGSAGSAGHMPQPPAMTAPGQVAPVVSPNAGMPAPQPMSTESTSHNDVANATENTTGSTTQTTEKEWVQSAKNVVNTTSNNPYEKSLKLAALRKQYLSSQFGKNPESSEQKI